MLDNNGKLINPEVRIETTTHCNASCTICPREKLTRPKINMLFDDFINLVDQAKDMGAKTIGVFGFGEPLTDMGLEEKISYCRLRGLETFVTTNGTLMDYYRSASIILSGLTHVRFSVHGEKVQGTKLYQQAIRHIGNFITINREKFHKSCKISITMIPMGKNIDPLIAAWEGTVDWIEIWKPHNWTDGRTYRNIDRKKSTCGRPFRGPVQINSDGTVMVCCFDFDGKLTIGDT
jgi:MoaA/NifB/PqqE/SkfB family radical SAM enzyme